jgi:hypothetical protein
MCVRVLLYGAPSVGRCLAIGRCPMEDVLPKCVNGFIVQKINSESQQI